MNQMGKEVKQIGSGEKTLTPGIEIKNNLVAKSIRNLQILGFCLAEYDLCIVTVKKNSDGFYSLFIVTKMVFMYNKNKKDEVVG